MMATPSDIVFCQADYRKIVDAFDDVILFMKEKFGKTEDEAQVWMESFMREHYFPCWRAMNRE